MGTASALQDVIRALPPSEGRLALQELGPRTGLKVWEIKGLEAYTFDHDGRRGSGERLRESLRAVADATDAPKYERARALLRISSSLRNENRAADGLVVLREMIAQYESDPVCQGEIKTARKLVQDFEDGKR